MIRLHIKKILTLIIYTNLKKKSNKVEKLVYSSALMIVLAKVIKVLVRSGLNKQSVKVI